MYTDKTVFSGTEMVWFPAGYVVRCIDMSFANKSIGEAHGNFSGENCR